MVATEESDERQVPVASVVIAAHNEAVLIGDCLDALRIPTLPLEVVVVANGCTDDTAEVARRRSGTLVVETSTSGKAQALNLGDRMATIFPRIYLDADIVAPPGSMRALVRLLTTEAGPLAAVPGRQLDAEGRPLMVRCYAAIHDRLPGVRNGLFGRGMIGVSTSGRQRFDRFPLLVADDLFLDSLFSDAEREVLDEISVKVQAPRSTRDLLRRLARVRRGNSQLRAVGRSGELPSLVRPAARTAWIRVVAAHPRLAPAGVVYALLTLMAEASARWSRTSSWGRDESTRTVSETGQETG